MSHSNPDDTQDYVWQAIKHASLWDYLPGACVLEEEPRLRKENLAAIGQYLQARGCRIIVVGHIPAEGLPSSGSDEIAAIDDAVSRLQRPITFDHPDIFEALKRAPSDERPLALIVANLELPVRKLDHYLRESRSRPHVYTVVGAEVDSDADVPGAYTVFDPHIFPVVVDGNWSVREPFD